jgi:hypothetical protein
MPSFLPLLPHSPLPHHAAVVCLPTRHLLLVPFPRISRHSRSRSTYLYLGLYRHRPVVLTFFSPSTPLRPSKPDANTLPHRTLVDAFPPAAWAFPSPPMVRSTRRRCTLPPIHPSRVIVACVVVRLAHHSPKLLIASLSHASHCELHIRADEDRRGDRPVVLLLGIRLGLDGVNPRLSR